MLDKALDWGLLLLNIVLDYGFYIIVLYYLYKIVMKLKTYIRSLFISCDPNQWIVISRGGNLIQAGIGLTCFVTPFDSVAIFPSKQNKVEIQTQALTTEMQGVLVSSMITWNVQTEGNGPLKAYENLDLASGNFESANSALRDLTGAIVRERVANSELQLVLTERESLR